MVNKERFARVLAQAPMMLLRRVRPLFFDKLAEARIKHARDSLALVYHNGWSADDTAQPLLQIVIGLLDLILEGYPEERRNK